MPQEGQFHSVGARHAGPRGDLFVQAPEFFFLGFILGSLRSDQPFDRIAFAFQRALADRQIPLYTEEMLADDLQTLKTLYPS